MEEKEASAARRQEGGDVGCGGGIGVDVLEVPSLGELARGHGNNALLWRLGRGRLASLRRETYIPPLVH